MKKASPIAIIGIIVVLCCFCCCASSMSTGIMGANAVGDVVSGKAFKPKLKKVDDPRIRGLTKHILEEKEKQRKQKEEEKKAAIKSALAGTFARAVPRNPPPS